MPDCKNCGQNFPNRVIIDGVLRVLSSRKYCLECSPYGLHNTRVLRGPDDRRLLAPDGQSADETVVCSCGRAYIYDRKLGHSRTKCNSCMSNANRAQRKLRAIDYMGGCCIVCGYNKCPRSLVFHHKDPHTKEFAISYGTYSWDKLQSELDKCVLLCSNCHGEVHDGLDLSPYLNSRVAA